MGRGRRLVAPLLVVGALAAAVGVAQSSTAGAGSPVPSPAVDDGVRLNQIQVVGSHNSFKRMLSSAEQGLRQTIIGVDNANKMAYQHEPLATQFATQKVRQIELDVFVDRNGGKYANPLIRTLTGGGAYDPVMAQPGIKVMHVQDVDYLPTCFTFVRCLQDVKGWSDANPSHLPIGILVELKDENVPPFTIPDAWTTADMDGMDAEIRSVFGPGDLITPDDVRGGAATLNQAITTTGWPTLGQSRGKVLFAMDNDGAYRTNYLAGHPGLQGRVAFTNSKAGQADGAFIKVNDPSDPSIPGLVQAGYLVRTRADADTLEARANTTGPRDKALASGAQWVSSDYPAPGMAYGFTTPYSVQIPGGTVGRCNPVNGPAACRSAWLDPQDWPDVPTTTTTTTTTTTPTSTSTSTSTTTSTSTSTTSSTTSTTIAPTTTTTTTLPTCVPDVVPFASATGIVSQLFEDLADRAPTANELAAWAPSIAACDASPDTLAVELLPTDATRSDARLVRLYLAFFQRPPDSTGLAHWQAKLASGRGLINVARSFAGSSEFKTTYGTLSNGAFVDLVYANVLGRPAEPTGRAFWVKRLDAGTKNRGDVMINFSESTENQAAKADDVATFRLFRALRERVPSAAEFDALTAGTVLQAARTIRLSPGYADRF